MTSAEELVTEHIDIWTEAIKHKSSSGRGGGKKHELYGVQKLRELILDLGIRGLLVPQDLEDEPATVLVEKISAAKSILVKTNKLKKPKKLDALGDDEIPFDFPDNWEVVRLGNAINVLNGRAYKKHEMLQEGTPLLRVGNLFTSKEWYYPDLELEPEKYIDNGDLIYSWSASFGPFIWEGGRAIYHYHIWKMDFFDKHSLDKYFIKLYLQAISASIKASGNGIAMIHMTKDRMEKLALPIPPLSEQHRIVAKVDELMALCDQLEQQTEASITAHQTLVETLLSALTQSANTIPSPTTQSENDQANPNNTFEQAWQRIAEHFDTLFTTEHSIELLKQNILQLAMMGKLVPQDPNDEPASELLKSIASEKVELIKAKNVKKQKATSEISKEDIPFTLPDGWEWCRLPEVGELARGKSKHRPRNAPILYINGTIPLVQTGDVSQSDGFIKTYTALYNETGLSQSRLWPKGTMCITIAANIADTGVLTFDACFPDSVVGFIPYLDEIEVKYFDYFIRTAKNDLEKFAPSTAQKNINLEILGNLLVPLPPLNELNRITAKVNKLFALCNQIKARLVDAQNTQIHLADTLAEQATT